MKKSSSKLRQKVKVDIVTSDDTKIYSTGKFQDFTARYIIKPFPKQQILDSSKLKKFADDNFEFDKNGKKFFKQVENTVGKGEIACYEQFLFFPQCL